MMPLRLISADGSALCTPHGISPTRRRIPAHSTLAGVQAKERLRYAMPPNIHVIPDGELSLHQEFGIWNLEFGIWNGNGNGNGTVSPKARERTLPNA